MRQSIEELIEHMVSHGSSLTINWGEDTGCYEVDWITSGERFRGINTELYAAMRRAMTNAAEHFGVEV
jgi:hypothetical protein